MVFTISSPYHTLEQRDHYYFRDTNFAVDVFISVLLCVTFS